MKMLAPIMGVTLGYNFKQFPYVHPSCQPIRGISNGLLKILVIV